MTQFASVWPLLLAAALLVVHQTGHCAEVRDKKAVAAPPPAESAQEFAPFPRMFLDSDGKSLRRIGKLVVGTSSLGGPMLTQEEYIDLEQGKFALVQSIAEESLYVSAHEEIIFKYRPYTCDSFAKDADIFVRDVDNFHAVRNIAEEDGATKPLKIYGAMGLWLEAEYKPMSYSNLTTHYGVERYEKVEHFFRTRVAQYFLEFKFNDAMILESVVVKRSTDLVVVKTYTVLSMEFGLDEIKEDVLEVPVGYDCSAHLLPFNKVYPDQDDQDQDQDQDPDQNSGPSFWNQYVWSDALVKLEVTATKYGTEQQQQPSAVYLDGPRPSSADTVYVELAHASGVYSNGPVVSREQLNGLVMTKIKSKRQETRTILNHHFNVRYHIDSRTGQCKMSHFTDSEPDDKRAILMEEDDLALEFANGLKFPMHKSQIESLFNYNTIMSDYRLMRRITRPSWYNTQKIDYLILERPQQAQPTAGNLQKWARVLATVAIVTDIPSGQTISHELESFTVWLMPPQQSWLDESYHFSVVKKEFPLGIYPDVAQLFDVSEECYLNDPTKKSGLDYAWAELFYPLSGRRLDVLTENEFPLKQSIYKELVSSSLMSTSSVPRLELMISDEGLFVRFLLLDLPKSELIFDSKQGVNLVSGDESDGGNQLRFTLPDVRHCAQMCQLHDCLAMSFCSDSRACVLSKSPAKLSGSAAEANSTETSQEPANIKWQTVASRANCVTYSHSKPSQVRQLQRQRLANVIAVLQNQDYDNLELPQMPDELALPRDETNVSQQEYNKLAQDYFSAVGDFMLKQGDRLPSLMLTLNIEDHFILVLPTKFQVEDNPLEQFALGGSSGSTAIEQGADIELQDPKQILQFFHTGLSGHCLDMSALNQNQMAHKETGAGPAAPDAHIVLNSFSGVTYDQCALACLDSSCGIFSYCATSLNCIISNMHTLPEAHRLNYIREDRDCLISQRDYAQHFQKYPKVELPPRKWSRESLELTPNDCATKCVQESEFNCYAFEFCQSSDPTFLAKCYLQEERQRDKLSVSLQEIESATAAAAAAPQKRPAQKPPAGPSSKNLTCDLYERDYLAEFTQINLHSFKHDVLDHYDSVRQFDLTSFQCADQCLNQMNDCSAFEFCFRGIFNNQNSNNNNYEQSCTLIAKKPADNYETIPLVVSDQDQLNIESVDPKLRSSQWPLEYSSRCHVFALKPNTIQAHLRNLALGQTMTRHELEQERAKRSALGVEFSWSSLFVLVLTLVSVSGVLGFGLCWARERNGSVRHTLNRLEAAIRRPFDRFAAQAAP